MERGKQSLLGGPARCVGRSWLLIALAAIVFLGGESGRGVLSLARAQVVGIDVGSEFIKAALVAPGKRMEILLNPSSGRKFANVVFFGDDGRSHVAEDAAGLSHKHPDRVLHFLNLFFGLSAAQVGEVERVEKATDSEGSKEAALRRVSPFEGLWPGGISSSYYPYAMFEDPERGSLLVKVKEGLLLPPEAAAASLFSAIRATAAASAGLSVSSSLGVVAAVPCDFSQRQRAALRDSLEVAGFKVLGLVSTAGAAAVQHALDTNGASFAGSSLKDSPRGAASSGSNAGSDAPVSMEGEERYPSANDAARRRKLLLDVGSSGSDAALVEFEAGVETGPASKQKPPVVTVLACKSIHTGGGRALDVRLADFMRLAFEKSGKMVRSEGPLVEGVLLSQPRVLKKLERQAQHAKKVLSASKVARFRVEGLYKGLDFDEEVQRTQLEELLQDSMQLRNIDLTARGALGVDQLPSDGEASSEILKSVSAVELLGGAWRVPRVFAQLQNWAGEKLKTHLNGDEAMATGAAFIAASLTPAFRVRKLKLNDSTPHKYSVNVWQGGDTAPIQKVLFPAFSKLQGKKAVEVNDQRSDFRVDLVEDGEVIATFSIGGVEEALQKLSAEGQPEGEELKVRVELEFATDTAGVIDLVNASFVAEKVTSVEDPAPADTSSESSSSSSNSPSKKKTTLRTQRLSVSTKLATPLPLPTSEKADLRARLLEQEKFDAEAKAHAEVLNSLEAFIYETRSQVTAGRFDQVVPPSWREEQLRKLDEEEDWVTGPARAERLTSVRSRLSKLHEEMEVIRRRAAELEARPRVKEAVQTLLNSVESRLSHFQEQKPWVPAARLDAARSLVEEFRIWWKAKMEAEATRSLTEEPAYTKAEVELRLEEINQRFKALDAIPRPTTTTTTTAMTTTESSPLNNSSKDGESTKSETEEEEAKQRAAEEQARAIEAEARKEEL